MSKSPADKIKEAAAGETDPKALSGAAEISGPGPGEHGKPQGDGKAPYREDFESVYKRLDMLDKTVYELGQALDALGKAEIEAKNHKAKQGHGGDIEDRVANIERRLHGVVSE